MDTRRLTRLSEFAWRIEPRGDMRAPVVIYGDETLVTAMDDKVHDQAVNVTQLPGIAGPVYAMPDAHWGYGFPIGGVAAFDPDEGGVISAGGVGFDIACGVRTLTGALRHEEIEPVKKQLAEALYARVPVGVGSTGALRLSETSMDAMLTGGARWAVTEGYGSTADLDRIEEGGQMRHARADAVSARARKRQRDEMGTLGSGNHYLEVQEVAAIHDERTATAFGLQRGNIVVSVHCGSRGLGHQIGTEFLREMVEGAGHYRIRLPDRELACAPINSELGQRYLGAMRAAMNCAMANRQILTQLTREVFAGFFPHATLPLLYDVSHNTCKVEQHVIDGRQRQVYVHRKGATRAFGPGHSELPKLFRDTGQPVLIGGSMGTASYVLAGNAQGERLSLASACHGAGRAMSRRQALKQWRGREVIDELAARGIVIRSPSDRGVAEEAPGAYKDVDAVVEAADRAGLARKVATLKPLVCIKG
ncbi:MAG: RtcB family protein [Chromatiales bacterium]